MDIDINDGIREIRDAMFSKVEKETVESLETKVLEKLN